MSDGIAYLMLDHFEIVNSFQSLNFVLMKTFIINSVRKYQIFFFG